MSPINSGTFSVDIVTIKSIEKHENADTLSICKIYDYNVIVKNGQFKVGDKAVYIPVDSVLPSENQYAFVWENKPNPSPKQRRVRAKRLRGVFSEGLLMPIDDTLKDIPEGTDVASLLNITKYEPQEEINFKAGNDIGMNWWQKFKKRYFPNWLLKFFPVIKNKRPSWFIEYPSVQNIKKYKNVIPGDSYVLIEMKIHGTNMAFAYKDKKFWISSHHCMRKLDEKNIWGEAAIRLNLKEKAKIFPNYIFFGELYGHNVQKGFDYGLKQRSFILYDIYDTSKNEYLGWRDVRSVAGVLNLNVPDTLYIGPWENVGDYEKLAEGNVPNTNHCTEGIIIRVTNYKELNKIGRPILKLKGQQFLLEGNS